MDGFSISLRFSFYSEFDILCSSTLLVFTDVSSIMVFLFYKTLVDFLTLLFSVVVTCFGVIPWMPETYLSFLIGKTSFPLVMVSLSFRIIFFVPWKDPLEVLVLWVIFLDYFPYSFNEIPSELSTKKFPLLVELTLLPEFLVDKKHPLID